MIHVLTVFAVCLFSILVSLVIIRRRPYWAVRLLASLVTWVWGLSIRVRERGRR